MQVVVHFGNRQAKFDTGKGFDRLLAQLVTQFKVNVYTVQLIFVDEEGDSIMVASDSDLQIMGAISNGHLTLRAQKQTKNNFRSTERHHKNPPKKEQKKFRQKQSQLDDELEKRVNELVDKRFKTLLAGLATLPRFKDIDLQDVYKRQSQSPKKEEKQGSKKEEVKQQEDEEVVVTESMLRPPEQQSPAEVAAKGRMLGQMKDIFGNAEGMTKKYYNFIKKHYKKGFERVVQVWIAENQQKCQ